MAYTIQTLSLMAILLFCSASQTTVDKAQLLYSMRLISVEDNLEMQTLCMKYESRHFQAKLHLSSHIVSYLHLFFSGGY